MLRGQGAPLRHPLRHRGDPPRLRGVWRRLRAALQRPMGVRPVGQPAAGGCLLSRDRFGVRPLYYTMAGGKFLFASEIKSLFAHRRRDARQLDPLGLDQVFTFWSPLPPRTVFRGICELPPGHNLVVCARADRRRAVLAADVRPEPADGPSEAELRRAAARTAARRHAAAAAGRRAGRGLSERRAGLDGHRRAGPAVRPAAACGPSRSPSTTPSSTRAATSGRRSSTCGPSTRRSTAGASDIGRVFPRGDLARRAARAADRAGADVPARRSWCAARATRWCSPAKGPTRCSAATTSSRRPRSGGSGPRSPSRRSAPACSAKLYPYLPNLQAQPLAYRKAFFHVRPEDLASPLFSHLPRWELTARLKTVLLAPSCRRSWPAATPTPTAWPRLPAGFAGWHPFCQAQYLETHDAAAGLHPFLAGRPDGDGPCGRGAVPVPRSPRGRVRRRDAPAAEDAGAATRSTC